MRCLFFILPFIFCTSFAGEKELNMTVPVVENRNSIANYIASLSLSTSDLYYLDASAYMPRIKENGGMPVLHIYNKEGYYVKYTATKPGCSDPTFALSSLPATLNNAVDSAIILQAVLSELIPYDAATVSKESEATIVIYWAKFLGFNYSNDKVQHWEKTIKETYPRARIIKVNIDAQEEWGQDKQDEVLSFLTELHGNVLVRQSK